MITEMACYNPKYAYLAKDARTENFGRAIFFSLPQCYEGHPEKYEKINIPCRRCIGCRLDYSREWATRIERECRTNEGNIFLTLTYDEAHLPRAVQQLRDGTTKETPTTKISELSSFMKRLRRHWEYHYGVQGIKFFGASEYGDKTGRPHYHVAIMGLKNLPSDMVKIGNNHQGDIRWASAEIAKLWGKGIIEYEDLTWGSAAYVARYITKKQFGAGAKEYERLGIEEPKVVMSRNPGIGMSYIRDNIETAAKDEIFVKKKGGVMSVRNPKVYRDMYKAYEPDQAALLSEMRRARANDETRAKLKRTTMNETELLKAEGEKKEAQAKMLLRNFSGESE